MAQVHGIGTIHSWRSTIGPLRRSPFRRWKGTQRVDNSRLISLLHAIPLFADLEDSELMDVLRNAQPVQHDAGHVICRQGDPGDCMYVIQSGDLTINIKAADGRSIPVATLKAGDLLGEMTLVDAQPRSADVIAATQVRMFRIDRSAFDSMRKLLHPAVFKMLRRIGLTTCARLRKVNETVSRVVGTEDPELAQRATAEVRTRSGRAADERTDTDIDRARNFWGGLMGKLKG